MTADILNPLQEFNDVFRPRFKEVAEQTFEELANEAQVDIAANKQTCTQLYETQQKCDAVKSSITGWTVLCVLLWIMVAAGVIVDVVFFQQWELEILLAVAAGVVASALFLLLKVHPKLKQLKKECGILTAQLQQLRQQAWKQMAPLNRLYDWDVLTRMMTQTVPRLEFDPYFTNQRLADLHESYGWDDSFNSNRSVIFSHSGLINGNPFIICQTRKMVMGSKSYQGHLTIHWTTYERGADGKGHVVHHTETLYATVTAPYPEYPTKTRVIYANTAAPDLIFNRKKSGLAGKEGTLSYKHTLRKLRKKAEDLENSDFAMMTNEDFEVAFDTRNRNNNQQFALLFTALAQENILNLLKDKQIGFGDDFDFDKNKMINIITPDHLQGGNLDMNPSQFQNFDFEKAKQNFCLINEQHFRAIYFALAPLLCVPMYQQIRPQQDIYGRDMQRHSTFWEHEALANFWGKQHFQHPACVTECILKTHQDKVGDNSTITVMAYGYRVKQRITYVPKWGGDGNIHQVPVYWDEYLPVTGTGSFQMSEDNDFDDTNAKNKERHEHIANILRENNFDIYRRHIASKM